MMTWYKKDVKKCALRIYKVLRFFDIKKELNCKIFSAKQNYIKRVILDYYRDSGYHDCYNDFKSDVKHEVYRQLSKHNSKNAILFRR